MNLFDLDEELQTVVDSRECVLDQIEEHQGLKPPVEAGAEIAQAHQERGQELAQLLKDADCDLVKAAQAVAKKVDGFGSMFKWLDLRAKVCRKESQRLANVARRAEALADYLEGIVLDFMAMHDKKKLTGIKFNLTAAGNGGLAPLELNPDLLTPPYLKVTVELSLEEWKRITGTLEKAGGPVQATVKATEPHNAAIRQALKDKLPVVGARVADRAKHLLIT